MPIRTNGGVFNQQVLTGSLSHWVICGANFNGAINQYGKPVLGSAAEIIFENIEEGATVNIMNPNSDNLSFALEEGRSTWDEISLTIMVQSLGNDVGVDHVDCTVCTVKRVPYIWGYGASGTTSFLDLTDTPDTYAGAQNYVVTVNSTASGLVFTPIGITSNAFSFIDVPSQPTITATGSDTLTILPGENIYITTDAISKSVVINSTNITDYIATTPGSFLGFSKKYYVTSPGTVYLPNGTLSTAPIGTAVIVTKSTLETVFINTTGTSDIIATDLGNTNSIQLDVTEECVFIFDGISTWQLQIGSRL
jgi:hypothetical protein